MLSGTQSLKNYPFYKSKSIEYIISSSLLSEKSICEILEGIFSEKSPCTLEKFDAGDSAVHLAVKYNLPEVLKLLIKNNYPINMINDSGKAPIHYATQKGYEVILLILCYQTEIEINKQDNNGDTALHMAVNAKLPNCVSILVKNNTIDLDICNNDELTAQDLIQSMKESDEKYKLSTALRILPVTNMHELEFKMFPARQYNVDDQAIKVLNKKFSQLKLGTTHKDKNVVLNRDRYTLHARSVTTTSISATVPHEKIILETKDFISGNTYKLQQYLNDNGNPNALLAPHNEPLLHYAFIYKQKALFCMLSCAGASLKTNNLSTTINNIMKDDSEGIHANFLFDLQKDLLALTKEKATMFNEKLDGCASELHISLIKSRLKEKFTDKEISCISHEKILSLFPVKKMNDCAKNIIELCSGIKRDSARVFMPINITQNVISLLDRFEPNDIIKVLGKLIPHLKNIQKLICIYIFKEMLSANLAFQYPINEELISDFINIMKKSKYNYKLRHTFLKYSKLAVSRLNDPMITNNNEINKLIAFYPFKKENSIRDYINKIIDQPTDQFIKKDSFRNHTTYLADEISTLSIQFLQVCDLKEFRENVWEKNKSQREENSPNIVAMENILNCLSLFISGFLTGQTVEHKKINVFILFLHTARKSIDNSRPDFNVMISILNGLEKGIGKELNGLLSKIRNSDKKLFHQLMEFQTPCGNFQYIRHLTNGFKNSIPTLPIILHDKLHMAEKKSFYMIGKIYLQLLNVKNELEFIPIESNSDLTFELSKLLYQAHLIEASNGNCKNLANHCKQSNVNSLDLSQGKAKDIDLVELVQDLHGTNVTKLDLADNDINGLKLIALIKSMQDKNIKELDLKRNLILPKDIPALYRCLEGTSLIKIDLDFDDLHLNNLLSANHANLKRVRWTINHTPLELLRQMYLSDEERAKVTINSLSPNDNELQYAGGIFLRVPNEIKLKIISFLPMMTQRKLNGYKVEMFKKLATAIENKNEINTGASSYKGLLSREL